MSSVTVSILMLTHNRFALSTHYIPQIINNIGAVSSEVFIWDNCSNDGTLDWLCEYAKINPLITEVFPGDRNYGLEAINFMAAKARGDYLIKVDDDIRIPYGFVQKLISAYEVVSEPKLAYLAYDIQWGRTTYATRAGMGLYQKDVGRIVRLPQGEQVLITYHPDKFTLASMCRLSLRKTFLDFGGHPAGIVYGVDKPVSDAAARAGMCVGFLTGPQIIEHMGSDDKPEYRALKDRSLHQRH